MPPFFRRRLASAAAIGCLLGTAACGPAAPAKTGSTAPPPAEDDRTALDAKFLEMFARAYYPGRSGQVMLVPEPGEVLLEPDSPFYRFMHGSPWDYDVEIPLVIYGPGRGRVRPGAFDAPVTHRDIAPTLAAVLGIPGAATMTGRVLDEAVAGVATPPRAVLLVVLDGARRDSFERYAADLPTFARLRAGGAWFTQAAVDYLPSLTSVGHASIATGAEPRLHGIVANTMFDRRTDRPSGPFPGSAPDNLAALTIADLWNLQTRGKAVIIAQGTTPRATIPMAGHGGCLVSAAPVVMAMFDAGRGAWVTNDRCYRLPAYVAGDTADRVWRDGETWLGHEVSDSRTLLRTGWFATFQTDALVAMIEAEGVGHDATPDLILANFKTLDYVGHRWGPDSEELRSALRTLDAELGRILAALEAVAGPEEVVVVVVSDHGTPAEPDPPATDRRYITDIVDGIHDRFDPDERRVVFFYGDAADNQMFIDRDRLSDLGLDLDAVAAHIEALPYIFSAYTEDEVAAASGR